MKTKPSYTFAPLLLPALRARMGLRWYYVATMTFNDVTQSVQKVGDIHERRELKTWIQRELRPERTHQIAEYLRSSEHFFSALVLGVYAGEPEFRPIDVKAQSKDLELADRQSTSFGIIHLTGLESIFAIDGQHRVEGIKAAVAADGKLGSEEQTVIFVAHNVSDKGREHTRRLFSTLNGYARPVAESELVALSEDDAFAIATRHLIDTYPGLSMMFVPLLPSANIPAHEKTAITSVVGLYHLTQALAPEAIRRAKKKHKIGPATPEVIEAIISESKAFWDALKSHVSAIRDVCDSKPKDQLAAKYRHPGGGHLLFRTVGMKAFAKAARNLVDNGESMDKAVKKLARVPLMLSDDIWEGVLWRPETNTMLTKYVRLAQNIFLHEAGFPPATKGLDVEAEYERLTGNEYPE